MNERIMQEEFERGEKEYEEYIEKFDCIKHIISIETGLTRLKCENITHKILHKLKQLKRLKED